MLLAASAFQSWITRDPELAVALGVISGMILQHVLGAYFKK